MASGAYAKGLLDFLAGSIDWDADTIKVCALKTGFAQNKETQFFLQDISTSRYVGTTDQTLGSKTNVIVSASNYVRIGGGAVTFSTVALDASNDIIGFAIYKDTGNSATSPLIAFDDAADITPNGGDVTYTPNANGILQLSYGA